MTTQQILKALRNEGLSAKSSWPKLDTPAAEWPNVQVLGGRVLNVCTNSILGFGCIDNPQYDTIRQQLCSKVETALTALDVRFYQSLPDQYVLSWS